MISKFVNPVAQRGGPCHLETGWTLTSTTEESDDLFCTRKRFMDIMTPDKEPRLDHGKKKLHSSLFLSEFILSEDNLLCRHTLFYLLHNPSGPLSSLTSNKTFWSSFLLFLPSNNPSYDLTVRSPRRNSVSSVVSS